MTPTGAFSLLLLRNATKRRPRSYLQVGIAALALLAGALPAQWGNAPGRGRLFSLPRSQDDIYEWRRAQTELDDGSAGLAVERLHRLLQSAHPGVVPLDEDGEFFMGLHAAVLATLCELPDRARDAYEKLTQRDAARLLRTAFAGAHTEELAILADTFPASEAGRRARLRLGDMALEGGRGIEAEFHYRAALDSTPTAAPEYASIQQRMWAAQTVSGGSTHSTSADADRRLIAGEIGKALPSGIAGREGGWPAYGGGGNGTGIMAKPLGDLQRHDQIDVRAHGFRDRVYPMHAVGDMTGILLNNGVSIHCYDPLSGGVLWKAPGPLADDPQSLDGYQRSINPDVVLAPACNTDIVVAALQVPALGQNTRFRHIDVIRHIPRRRLFAVDRATGKRLWSHWDQVEGPITRRFEGHDAAGPPMIFGDTVYIASHDQTGAVAYYLTAYDVRTGEQRWRQLICSSQGEVNMFGNSRREYAASALALADGMILGSTNLGVCFAADAATGRIRWITAYDVIPLPETRLTDQRDRLVIFANNSVAVADGVMACTPLDSSYGLGFDIATGKLLWRLDHRWQRSIDVRWLLGAQGDEFIFAGLGVVAVKARPTGRALEPSVRRVRSPESLGLPTDMLLSTQTIPRGALTEDSIYYSSPAGLRVFDRQGDTREDKLASHGGLGNLLLVDGMLVSVRDGSLEFYYDRDQLVRAAEERVRRNSHDVTALLRLASLVRGGQDQPATGPSAERAEKLFQRGLDAARRAGLGPTSPTYRRLAGELFRLSVARAIQVRAHRPDVAIGLMRKARDGALRASDWLLAQRSILEWVQDDRTVYLAELELMAQRHGSQVDRFPGQQPMPVMAYVLWQTALHTADATDAVRRCQELMERFPDVELDKRPARELARDRQRELIRQHGREVYAPIESQAEATLELAGEDPDLLASLAQRYPHSVAAKKALAAIMDHAVGQGDLAAAARSYSQALAEGHASPGVTRRMMEAARIAGNTPLARELARRLLAEAANTPSDYGPDGGRAMKDVVALPDETTPPKPVSLQRPFDIIAEKQPGSSAIPMRLCRTRLVDGFPVPERVPMLVSVDSTTLEAFDASLGGRMFEQALYSVPFQYQEGEDLLICGETLVLPGLDKVRGLDLRTGEEKWVVEEQSERMLVSLGCQAGILHLFSERRRDAGDGGVLLGVEPISGAIILRHAFPRLADSAPPASSGGHLWVFEQGDENGGVQIVGLDPLDGRPVHRVPLDTPLLRRLDLENADTRSYRAYTLHKTLFADDDTVYLPIDGNENSTPRLAAIAFDGRERWMWRGRRGREIHMAATYGNYIVVLERGSRGSHLAVLNRVGGSPWQEKPLGPMVSLRNWSRREHSIPAPDELMIVDHGENLSLNLTCWSLDRRVSSFQHTLHGRHEHVVSEPLLDGDFLAIAARRRDDTFSLFVLDAKTRRSILPANQNQLRFPFSPPFKMQAVPPYIAIQHAGGIAILGEPGSQPK